MFDNRELVSAALVHYRQPHRGYHDTGHLEELMRLAREHVPDLDDSEQLALLFHDAVYVPGAPSGNNEKLSALLMKATAATLKLTGVDLERAAGIVEATQHAAPPPAAAARVCDLDLWRLAAPWEEFQRHTLGIRHENLHLHANEPAFWKARSNFLATFLARPFLYATPYFRERFEAMARENLKRSIARSPS